MRSLLVTLSLVACGQPRAARDPADAQRIAALEQRVATLEAQLQTASKQLDVAAAEKRMPPGEDTPAPNPVPPPPPPPPPGGGSPRYASPDSRRTYAVPLDDSPGIGPLVAPITIVASLQFPEPFTHRVLPTLMQLRGEYRKDLRIVVKLYIVHPKTMASSIAACAAAYQDGVEPMENAIWDAAQDPALQATPTSGMRQLDEVELRELARALRFDLKQYDQDLATCKAGLARDTPVLSKLGQHGVPAFWINGRPLTGAQPVESFRNVIEEELAKWKTDKAAGGKVATYYERITKNAPNAP